MSRKARSEGSLIYSPPLLESGACEEVTCRKLSITRSSPFAHCHLFRDSMTNFLRIPRQPGQKNSSNGRAPLLCPSDPGRAGRLAEPRVNVGVFIQRGKRVSSSELPTYCRATAPQSPRTPGSGACLSKVRKTRLRLKTRGNPF